MNDNYRQLIELVKQPGVNNILTIVEIIRLMSKEHKQLDCIIDKQLNGYPIEEVLREVNR